ncbi:MAG TPA: LptF/LptG family permease [Candidatus Pelagibacter bacterium]|jgi:lipopolysaccharide export system permease protein|nr:LptF/LptG family permease [Candidatus Pelagibacter bacterium]|tara:strand:- start:16177 stop:17331 length:1155 start_codon:yes stop_codon:yes gene_type:complete
MKKLIFKKFAKDVFQFFLLVSISISLIVWVIQAVNFLDIVTEDGHGFKVYFLYTLLSLPKIFSKILPFIYFISLFYIILKYENENELIIFWTIGIKKIEFVNVLLKFSIFYLILQLLLTTYVVPTTLDKARSYIRGSNVDLFSSIIQEKKFIDVVKNLTIFVEEKDNKGNLKNIFLKEKIEKNKSQTIFAKEGKIQKYDNKSTLLLFDGKIINNNNKKVNSFEFSKTEINLSKFTTKTTTHPKIQEIGTYNVLNCVIRLKNINNAYIFNVLITKKKLNNCIPENLKNSFQEIFKRLISPFYLLPLCLIACLIIIKSKDDYEYFKYKFGLFILGVITIIISEISIKYSSTKIIQNIHIFTLPILFLIVIYLYIKFKLKKPNLINQ